MLCFTHGFYWLNITHSLSFTILWFLLSFIVNRFFSFIMLTVSHFNIFFLFFTSVIHIPSLLFSTPNIFYLNFPDCTMFSLYNVQDEFWQISVNIISNDSRKSSSVHSFQSSNMRGELPFLLQCLSLFLATTMSRLIVSTVIHSLSLCSRLTWPFKERIRSRMQFYNVLHLIFVALSILLFL